MSAAAGPPLSVVETAAAVRDGATTAVALVTDALERDRPWPRTAPDPKGDRP